MEKFWTSMVNALMNQILLVDAANGRVEMGKVLLIPQETKELGSFWEGT